MKLNKYLIVLPCFPNDNGFNHQTVLVSAINEDEAKDKAKRLRPNSNIGEILGNIEYHFSLLRDVPKDFDYNKELGVYYN